MRSGPNSTQGRLPNNILHTEVYDKEVMATNAIAIRHDAGIGDKDLHAAQTPLIGLYPQKSVGPMG